MRTLKTLKPGQRRVIQRSCPTREAERPGSRKLRLHFVGAARRTVALRIGWRERDLQGWVKAVGGWRDPDKGVWLLRRDAAERLVLLQRAGQLTVLHALRV